jgi:hypothetical protein
VIVIVAIMLAAWVVLSLVAGLVWVVCCHVVQRANR